METKINTEIQKVLEQFDQKYILDGVINKSKVIQDLDGYDSDLVTALLKSEELRKRFTMKIADATIIKVNDLIEIFELDDYWQDSYTKYTKKIGLAANGKFLDETSEVVLDFPYKDTILKASMSKEDNGKDDLRPDEPFLNEIIAQDEIDVLLDEKILVNAKKYDADGAHAVTEFTDEDNLILKGNNLLALHTLKERYAGKVKLIYIDPPYNTGNDGFDYNDRFNHSAWLTFMKNRLEIARDLLSDDGSIWINIDDNESYYLKVLTDIIFNKNNFLSTIIWKKKYSPQNDAKFFSDMHDFIFVFSKNRENFLLNGLPRTKEMDSKYKNPDNDHRGPWQSDNFSVKTFSESGNYEIITPAGRKVNPPNGRVWMTSKERYYEMLNDGRIWFGKDGLGVPRIKRFLSEVKQKMPPQTIWDYTEVGHNQDARREILALNLFEADFSTPKPEKLLQRIIHLGSNEKDLILDFFMGSATTQAVAMKMNRRFIGIEQMDYINTVSVPRLQKVIEGEQGGISKDVNWQGGGSFVYAELMEKNTGFIKEIVNATNANELKIIFKRMTETADLDFRADLATLKNSDLWLEPVDDQKRLLIKIIDKNQLYYNYSEIDDEHVRELVSDNDYAFNQNFYQSEDK